MSLYAYRHIGLSSVNNICFNFNRILGKEGIFDQYRLTRYYEKPHKVMQNPE